MNIFKEFKPRPLFEMSLTWEAFSGLDGNGELLSRKTQKCHSYVKAMIDIMYACMAQTTLAGISDTGGVSRTLNIGSQNFAANAGATSILYGIVVGTGSAAVTIADYQLGTIIANGAGAGQLGYGACSVGTPSTSGTTRRLTIARTFTNTSGGTVTVNEVGLYIECTSNPWYFCAERSLSTQAINDLASATATYTIGVTV